MIKFCKLSNFVFCPSTMFRALWSVRHVLFLLLTSNLLWFESNKTAFALGNETDLIALLKFKESISNDPFEVVTSWNGSNHFCNWQGVTCGHRHQRVTELKLEGYHLHGFISPYVGNLSFLRIFNLGNNNLYGHVPQEMSRLFWLQVLYLANNTLEGEFPINLTNCSELRRLNLQGNHFTGQIPMEIDSLGKLEELYVDINNLTGQIPASIGNLSSLTLLSMAYNNLEGNIPEGIGQLKNLTKLHVGANELAGMLPSSLYNLSSLTFFSTAVNQFSGSLPANMFLALSNLRQIFFGGNQFSGQIPTSLTNASGIQVFDIYSNHFVGQVPTLGKLRALYQLVLSRNNFDGNLSNDSEFLNSLINCSQLNVLDIDGNNFRGPLPNFMGNLSTKLTYLYLGGNPIAGQIPVELGNLVNLILLTMEYNQLTGIIPATFSKFGKMQLISFHGNNLSGEIPAIIGNRSQLFKLELGDNMLSGNIPSTIGSCRNLQKLGLQYNNLSGHIPSMVVGLPSLLVLYASHNSLSSNLPAEVGMLKNIVRLDLSENLLSGWIPKAIGECTNLEFLYLQGNSFNGSIPPSLALLKGLQVLDLSQNNLSGSIPQGLQNISVLEYFNASFNMLEGEVPTNGVFRNASAFSVAGNSKVCGGVSELKLPPCPLKAMTKRKHSNLRLIVVIASLVAFFVLLSCIVAVYQIRKRHREEPTDSTLSQLPKVSYTNLHHSTDGFSTRNLIGKGSFGSVYKGSLDSVENAVAIKVLNLQKKGAHKSFIAECNALRNIRHRNLVKILTCCSSMDYNRNDFKALVLEFMSNGSLEEWLHGEKSAEQPQLRPLSLKKRLDIIMGVASAMHYLHYECEQPIIHCDLKPSNVLLDNDMTAHVSDFGLARILSTINGNTHNQTSTIEIKGTIGYAPPEYGMSYRVSTEGDVYSFGILLLEMLTGRRPTEEVFKDGHNLHNYVEIAFPNNFREIVDAALLSLEKESPSTTVEGGNNLSEVAAHLYPNAEKCLFSLLRMGLTCSEESPRERMNMLQVTRELNIIKTTYYKK